MKNLLEISGLDFASGPTQILKNCALRLEEGELVGLIGPNGAGKSTLLRCMLGWHRAQRGEIRICGKDLRRLGHVERALQMAYVAQLGELDPGLNVEQLVELGRYPHRSARRFARKLEKEALAVDDARISARALAYVGLESMTHRELATLSGGERRLAYFARALAQETPILLLDEPEAGLDFGAELRLFSILRELCSEGIGILACLHDLESAAQYCDRLVLMHEGGVVADGRPHEVLKPELLERVYKVKVRVSYEGGYPHIDRELKTTVKNNIRVHIIGGGGSAVAVTRLLLRGGYSLSGGIAHSLDNDAAAWEKLGVDFVQVDAFSPISAPALAEAARLQEAADFSILCDFPFGSGNALNLELAAMAKKLIILESGEGRSFHAPELDARFAALAGQRMSWQELRLRAESGNLL